MNASIEKTIETLLDKMRSASNTDQIANLTSVVERLMKLLVPPMLAVDTTEPVPTTALEGGKAYDARWNGHEWIITKKPTGTVNPHDAEKGDTTKTIFQALYESTYGKDQVDTDEKGDTPPSE